MNFTFLVKDFNKPCTIRKGNIIELFTLNCDLQKKKIKIFFDSPQK